MKRLKIFCVILLLCLQAFSGVIVYGAVVDGDILEITDTKIENDPSAIYEGQAFKLTLECKNKVGKDISKIYIDIDSSSSFYGNPVNSNIEAFKDTFSFDDDPTKPGVYDDTAQDTMPLQLVYKGQGHELILKFSYLDGADTITETQNIYIDEAHPTDNTPSDPVATTKYAPKLSISSSNIPAFTAGVATTVTFPIKNSSIYQAKNVKMSIKMADEAKAPIVLENLSIIQTVDLIKGNETKTATFSINTLKTAPDGIYAMKLFYQYQNAYGDNFGDNNDVSETFYIRISNNCIKPTLAVDNITVKQGTASESAVSLELTLKNLGTLPAKDVKVTLKGLKSGGFTAYNSTDVKYLNKISGNSSGTVTYQLMMPTSGAAGSNELSVKMDYIDEAGTAYSEENQIFVPAGEGEGANPAIAFEKIVSPQNALAANENFKISLNLKNNGADARNVKVSIAADKEIITKSLNPVYIEKLAAKSSKTVSFDMFASDEAVTKNYPLAVNVEYEDIFGVKYSASQYIGVFVENGSAKTVPRIIIDKYTLDPASVKASEDFTVRMSFLNTSRTEDVSNIKVTVSSDDGTFTPTDSGNTFYLESIPSKENAERELMMHVKPDAEQKSYILSVNFDYEDSKGNPYNSKEAISVRVIQNPRLVTGEMSLAPEAFMGQPFSIYVDFYNMGKSTLYNMMVKAEGDFDGQNLSYYVGNFEPGRTDSYDASIIPKAAGEMKGAVVFSFEDANGKITEVRKEFSSNVIEMPQQSPMFDENGMPVENGMGMGMPGQMPVKQATPLIFVIPVIVIIAIVVTIIVLRKRHTRRKEMSLDE